LPRETSEAVVEDFGIKVEQQSDPGVSDFHLRAGNKSAADNPLGVLGVLGVLGGKTSYAEVSRISR
jgi:hypothetical protein